MRSVAHRLLCCLTVAGCALAVSRAGAPAAPAAPLPRVLLLGDGVYPEPARAVAAALKGRVEVVYPPMGPGEARDSTAVLANLDTLLGGGKWDLIHFNVGLGDLVHRAPGLTSLRVLPEKAGGVRATTPAQYEQNLRGIVTRLRATGAKLVWASTTPIPAAAGALFTPGSEVETNAIAARIMAEHRIPVNDLHRHVLAQPGADKRGDPFSFPNLPLHPPVVESILRELGLP